MFDKKKTQLYFYPPAKQGDTYKVPNSVKYIGSHAFQDTSLKRAEVPKSVILIKEFAFAACDIETVTLPRVKKIGVRAFSDCKNLKSVNFSNNLVSIKNLAFMDCTALTKIRLPKLKKAVIPSNVKTIEKKSLINPVRLSEKSINYSILILVLWELHKLKGSKADPV